MTQQLEVGETYTSVNGMEWFCIAIDGDVAHMRHDHSPCTAAYAWLLDGTPLTISAHEYRIVFEPERGEVVLHGGLDKIDGWGFDTYIIASVSHRLTIPTLDGELATGTYTSPDGYKIKVEKL